MTKIDLPCSVITDLLPLYQDGLCSPESRELVEAHLQRCQSCRTLCDNLPLPRVTPDAVPDEAEAFRRLRKLVRNGKQLRALRVCAAVLTACFLVLNAVWFPVKYMPYHKLCGGFRENPGSGKGKQYFTESGGYDFQVKMPGYLNFHGGWLSVTRIPERTEVPQQPGTDTVLSLYLWPKISGETVFGVMFAEQQSAVAASLTQLYIGRDADYPEQQNPGTPEQQQHNRALYEAHRDEIRAMMKAAESQWPSLFE